MIVVVCAPPNIDCDAYASSLAEQRSLRLLQDPTRSLCESYGFQTLYDMPEALQGDCRRRLIQEHLGALESEDDAVFDHNVVPWLADWMRWHWSSTTTESWEGVLAIAKDCAQRYAKIHHISSGPQRDYDGYSWLDARNSRQVAALFSYLYEELGVRDRVQSVDL